jgi:hypothetical protein
MEQLLKKGAYALLKDENDKEGKAFCADDIENILAKCTRTRVIEGAGGLNRDEDRNSDSNDDVDGGKETLEETLTPEEALLWRDIYAKAKECGRTEDEANHQCQHFLGLGDKGVGPKQFSC